MSLPVRVKRGSVIHFRRPGGLLALVFVAAAVLLAPSNAAAAIFTVTNTGDSGGGVCDPLGECSLRQAIEAANTSADPIDFIHFDIGLGGAQTIQPGSPLPAMTGPTVVDGETQPGFDGFPIIQLDGQEAGASAAGLSAAGGTTIRALTINRFSGNGIFVQSDATGVSIQGNYIGTDLSGTLDLGNGSSGILVDAATAVIGGTTQAARNVISGNQAHGIALFGVGATGNVVQGNYIGTNAAGTAAIGNNGAPSVSAGVVADFGAAGNDVGGDADGAGNVIAGSDVGVWVSASDTVVQGNKVGTNALGTAALPNTNGIVMTSAAGLTVIGGSTALARNVVSGNVGNGIHDDGNDTTVQGNYIGTNASGDGVIANGVRGIEEQGAGAVIGGTLAEARNVISGNGLIGVQVHDATTVGVQGNYIGTDASGASGLGNGSAGVQIQRATEVDVGGAVGGGNVISDNTTGVSVVGGSVTGIRIRGNRIGTDADGAVGLGNLVGVDLDLGASGVQIGGTASGAGNLISANSAGIELTSVSGATILGNLIGTDATGELDLGNLGNGVFVGTSTGTTIGGTAVGARNVISGNGTGVQVTGAAAGAAIQGNYIGTNAAGTAAIGNGGDGVVITSATGAPAPVVGGATMAARNVISGNFNGVRILNSAGAFVEGNYIGTNAAGAAGIPNNTGVSVSGQPGNTIGGAAGGVGNLISGNTGPGVVLAAAADNSIVRGNYVGVNVAGTSALPNGGTGVRVSSAGNQIVDNVLSGNGVFGLDLIGGAPGGSNVVQGNLIGTNAAGGAAVPNGTDEDIHQAVNVTSANNIIGGFEPAERNVISGNTGRGIFVLAGASGNVIRGNYVGTSLDGLTAVPNSLDGILIGAASNNTVGGTAPAARNVISGNGGHGVGLITDAVGNFVQGNYIGTDATGAGGLGNGGFGVVVSVAGSNTIGGASTTAGEPPGNVISGNGAGGIRIAVDDSTGNSVRGNIVGATADGSSALPNDGSGVLIDGAASNTIGGPAGSTDFNLISGHDPNPGITISGATASNNVVRGNRIGTTLNGNGALPNGDGVFSDAGAHGNSILDNLIAGNLFAGVHLGGAGMQNSVRGNTIGLDLGGDDPLPNDVGVHLDSGSNEVGGTSAAERNVISGNTDVGVLLNSDGNGVFGNYIGTNAGGTGAVGNGIDGVRIISGANIIGGPSAGHRNVISGNAQNGIEIGSDGNTVQENFIGTNANGTAAVGNGQQGISILSSINTIGADGHGNVISGNGQHGVLVNASATLNKVLGNRIGTNAAGTAGVGNAREGVRVEGNDNTVGGTAADARNLLSGNVGFGVLLYGSSTNVVQGNYAGTDVTGTVAIANGLDGIGVDGGSGHRIGGTAPGAGNLASGNGNQGIALFGVDFLAGTSSNTVQGNLVGTQADGSSPLGNGGDGVRLFNATSTTVGGTTAAAANTIAHNGTEAGGDGVVVFGAGAQNTIRGNSIFQNSDLGIDLGADGNTPNDTDDTDTGPNDLQNFPVLDSVELGAEETVFTGELETNPGGGVYEIEVFRNQTCDPLSDGEGKTFVVGAFIMDDGGTAGPGGIEFTISDPALLTPGEFVTATATGPGGSTSEFSPCIEVASAAAEATITLNAENEEVIAGAQSVPTSGIDLAALQSTRGGTTESAPLDAIPLDAIPLDAIPLDAIPLDAIGFTSEMLRAALGGVHLSDIPLSTTGGWEAKLANTALAGVPLNTVTLADVYALNETSDPDAIPLDAIPLDAIDLSQTPLDAIGLGAIALGATPLDAIPLDAIDGDNLAADNLGDWCEAIDALPGHECSDPSELVDETLIGAAVRGIPLDAIPLDAIPLDAIPLDAIPLDAIPLDAIPLDAIPLDAIPLDAIPLDAIPLDAIDYTAPAPVSQLRAIPLDAIGGNIVDCSPGFDCSGKTLGEADAAGRIDPNATLLDLIRALIPGAHDASIADLIYGLPTPPQLTLGDLFALALGGEGAYDWSALDLTKFPIALHSADGGVITYHATVQVTGGVSPTTATIHATLPKGGFYKPGSTQLAETETETVVPLGEPTVGPAMLTWEADVEEGVEYELTYQVHAPLELGDYTTFANVMVSGMSEPAFSPPVGNEVVQTLEPNDTPEEGPVLEGDTLYFSYMLRGDIDRFRVPVPSAFGSRVKITLSHIAEGTDLDLTVAGPPAPTLRAAPLDAIPLQNAQLPDTEVNLEQQTQALPPETLQDVPLDAITTGTNVLRGTSDNRGNADEEVTLISQGESGEYLVQVSDYQGDSNLPYMLEVEVSDPPDLGECEPRSFGENAGQGVAGTMPSLPLPSNVNTLILVNQKRLGDTYGATAASNVMSKLNELAGRDDLGIVGAVIPVESDPGVAAAYADPTTGWDANPCSPQKANDVVREISQLIDSIEPSGLRYKVIVGGDDQIPFGRVPDETLIANETTYTHSFAGPNNQYKGAFGNGFLLTDDVWAEEAAPQLFGHELFVPDQAVGRLLETPGDIKGIIDAFLAVDGVIAPDRSLTTGYDFLTDGARAVNAPFEAAFGANANGLIGETWDADDLEAALFPANPAQAPDINSVNAHFDHTRSLPAAENAANRSTNLFTSQDVRDRGAGAVDQRVFFSMGCHSGLAVFDQIYAPADPRTKDWAQTFLSGGALAWIGNTGYGLGDTVEVAYTERLHALLSANLDELSVGEALAQAKQEYLSTLGIVGGYDAKVVMEASLFGLPMLKLGTGAPPSPPAPPPIHTDPATGLQAASFDASPSFTLVTTPDGKFYRAQTTQTTNRRPIEPVFSFDITQPGKVAHGIVITSLESLPDETNFDAAFSRVVTDHSEDEPELVGEASHPAKIQSISTFSSFVSPPATRQRAVLIAGVYRSDGEPDPFGIGIHRLYSQIGGYVLYKNPGAAFRPPELGPLETQDIGNGIGFAVEVTSADGAAEDVKVLYRDCTNTWRLSTLQPSGGNRWSGGGALAPNCAEIDYYLQAVNDGDVAVSSKKVQIEPLTLPGQVGETEIGFELAGELDVPSGWYESHVSVAITPSSGLEYSLDGGPFQAYTGAAVPVTTDGVHRVEARAEDGSTNTVGFAIDTTDPTVLMTTPPEGAVYFLGQSVQADFVCGDAGSGPASCTGIPDDGEQLDTSSLGTKTITVNAEDVVGNTTTFMRTYEVVYRDILFSSSRTGFGDIYAIGPSGGTPAQLTSGGAIDAEPAWSPDGTKVVFTRLSSGNVDLYVLDLAGGGVTRLTTHGAIDTSPAFSPDGEQIAFASNRGGNWDIYVIDVDDGDVTRLTTHSDEDLLPAWSPNGLQIAFMSTRTGDGDIYRLNVASPANSQTRLTRGSSASAIDSEPAWFGTRIAFSTNRHGSSNFELYTINASTLVQTRLTNQAGHQITPSWSRDGKRIAYMSSHTGNGDIYTAEVPNPSALITDKRQLTTHTAIDALPDW